MILSSITSGLVSGTDTASCPGTILGGINISADGTNACTVTLRQSSASGAIIFQQVTKTPMFIIAPLRAATTIHYAISGTGGSAQLYEWLA